jgi:hypothetical protein
MTQKRWALIIAPDDFPREYGSNYDAACRKLNLEPNRHSYVVCRVSTAAGERTLLTVDLDLLQDTEKAATPEQASLLGMSRPGVTAFVTGPWGGRFPAPGFGSQDEVLHVIEAALGPQPSLPRNQFGDFCREEPPGGRTAGHPDHPAVLLVLDLDRATLKGVAVWNPRTGQPGIATAGEAVEAAVREAVADTAAEPIVGKLWPPHAAPPALADVDAALTALKGAVEPQKLLLKIINVAARIAAAHAGLGAVAPLVGHFAEDLCKQYVRPPRETILVDVLSSVDIDLYAAADKLPDCAVLRDLSVEETSHGIEKLLTAWFSADRDTPRPVVAFPAQPPPGDHPAPGQPAPPAAPDAGDKHEPDFIPSKRDDDSAAVKYPPDRIEGGSCASPSVPEKQLNIAPL